MLTRPQGVGYSDVFYTYVGSVIFWGSKFWGVYLLGFKKKKILGGMKILWIFLGGHHKIGLYSGSSSMHLRVFS